MQRLHHHNAANHRLSGEDRPRIPRRALLHVHLPPTLLIRPEASHQCHRWRRHGPCTGSFKPCPYAFFPGRHSVTHLRRSTAQRRRPLDAWPTYPSSSVQRLGRIGSGCGCGCGCAIQFLGRCSGFFCVTRS